MSTPLLTRYGPVALVTGASEGIGRAFAEDLAKAGFELILVARRRELLDQLAAKLSNETGAKVTVVAQDLAKAGAIDRISDSINLSRVGLVVAAAGFGTSGPFLSGDLANELDMIDLNCRSVADLVHHCGNAMVAERRGGIILLGSLVALQGVPRFANYAATKAYVQSLGEGLYHELKPHNVDVLVVAPGPVGSGFAARAGMIMGGTDTPEMVSRDALRAIGRKGTVRPGRLGKLLEFALSPLPRRARTMILKQSIAGMTKHSAD
jgi:short-subunit dehydrogenase